MARRGFQVFGDLALTDDGRELVLVRGAEMALAQIRAGAEIWQGTVQWDPNAGLPMLQQILVKGPDLRVITQIFRSFLLRTAGVVSVDRLVCRFDRPARALSVDFACTCEDGAEAADVLTFAIR
jgi:hypothetical protein